MNIKFLSLVTVMLPLGASVFIGLLNKKITRTLTHTLANLCLAASFISASLVLYGFLYQDVQTLNFDLYQWATIHDLKFMVGFLIDRLTALMMVIVTSISFMVHLYTVGYMHDDYGYQRFFSYISLFTFAMLMLVMSNNFLQLFFGWEAVGVVSYLLIGFWFVKDSATSASLKAFLVNRVGDVFFLLGMAIIIKLSSSVSYVEFFEKLPQLISTRPQLKLWGATQVDGLSVSAFCLFIGAMAKSAQIPLHNWLPDSMEGPTPISALIHAATMVTAGIFMVSRLSYLYQVCPQVLSYILVTGAVTSLSMGILGLIQSDIKRVIAYSTLSQLGYMVAALGASHYDHAIFHLFTHAFFKALLFLGAGAVILRCHHEQNIWKMGDLKRYLPYTYLCFVIATLSLCGFPFTSGFYSKDLIINGVKASNLPGAGMAYWALLCGVFVTALYSFRLLIVVFHTPTRVNAHTLEHLIEAPTSMLLPLILLSVPSAAIGYFAIEPLTQGFLTPSIGHFKSMEFEGAYTMGREALQNLPTWFALAGACLAFLLYKVVPQWPSRIAQRFSLVHQVLQHKYGFDFLYGTLIARGTRIASWVLARIFDQYLIDRVCVNGLANTIAGFSRGLRKSQNGLITQYAFTMVLGFLVLVAWVLFQAFDGQLVL